MNNSLIDNFIILQNYYKDVEHNKGKTIGYGKIINTLRRIRKKITSIEDVKYIKGIGEKAIEKIEQFLQTGKIIEAEEAKIALENIKKHIPQSEKIMKKFQTVHGIGPAKSKEFYEKGMRSIDDLKQNEHLLTHAQKIGIKYYDDLQKRVPRNYITTIYVLIIYFLNKYFGKNTYNIEIAGSYRRGFKDSGDIDCLISTSNFTLKDAVNILVEKNIVKDVLSMKQEKFMGIAGCPSNSFQNVRLDIQFISNEQWGCALLYFTGSKEFNQYMRSIAKEKGMLLNEHGLYYINSNKNIGKNLEEKEIFEKLKMKYVEPKFR
jgi:DNA polymerase beta